MVQPFAGPSLRWGAQWERDEEHGRRVGPSLSVFAGRDEALCFGWIDGIRRSLGTGRYAIRFTPRKKGSIWSAANARGATRGRAIGRQRGEAIQVQRRGLDVLHVAGGRLSQGRRLLRRERGQGA